MSKSLSAEEQIERRVEWLILICVIYGTNVGYFAGRGYLVIAGIFSLVFIVAILFFGIRWRMTIEDYSLGIRGEIKVAALLATIPDSWYASNVRLPNRTDDIDHVLLNESGIWVVETKHVDVNNVVISNGKLWNSGREENEAIKQVKRNAVLLCEYLKGQRVTIDWVKPVLVYSRDHTKVKSAEVQGVQVLGFRDLQKFLLASKKDHRLADAQRKKAERVLIDLVRE